MIWGLSLHGWEDLMRASLLIVGVSGLIAGLSTWYVVKLQRAELAQSTRELEEYKSDASVRAAELEKEAAQLRADNLETEKIIQPREFPIYGTNNDAASLNKELENFSGTKVWLQTVPDFEANRLSVSLVGLFNAVKWQVAEVTQSQTTVPPLGIFAGITIFVRYPYDEFPQPEGAAPDRLKNAADSLVKRLQLSLGNNFFSVHAEYLTLPPLNGVPMPPARAKVPDDTMLILVGIKPIGALVSEKKAKALAPQPAK